MFLHRTLQALGALMLTTTLLACGQTGPLYQPPADPPSEESGGAGD